VTTERGKPSGGVSELSNTGAEGERTIVSPQSRGLSLPGRTIPGGVPGTDAPARQVGRYQILGKLGEGAMATVYRAYDPSIDRPLVIKFLHPELCLDAEYRARFLREARAAGMLSHPNIVTVFDVGEIDGRPYIAMELLEGGPLSEVLHEGEGMQVRDVIDTGIQLASALDYAHSRGIYHRDIKPSNIIRLQDGRTVKLADFGIAHMAAREVTEHTRIGTVIGTPHYMAPEQTLGQKVDGRTDLWALGVILYQLLTGERPFDGDTAVTLAYRIAHEEPKPVGELRGDIPAPLRRIVMRCLAKAPEKRFQTGQELVDALKKVARELAAEADVDAKGRPRRIPLKLRLALAMAAVVAATMALVSSYVVNRQYQTMLDQTVAHGASLAKLIAAESAVNALSEDWVGIDVLVQDVSRALEVRGLSVADGDGVVRVSSDAAIVGQPLPKSAGESVRTREQGVTVVRERDAAGSTFEFQTPVTFQGKAIGAVRLGLPEEPLAAAARQAWWLMLVLLLVTAATVGLATYLLVERYSKPLRTLRESIEDITAGRFESRIGERRNDEFGELYQAFDAMAAQLQAEAKEARREGGSPPSRAEATGNA
jgi:serine/threonine-protein kinase